MMTRLRTFFPAALTVLLLLAAVVGCAPQRPTQPGLSDSRVRQLAGQYRDEWLAGNAPDAREILARSTIASVERQPQGWHVVFVTATGHDRAKPEGIHDYYLHVYLKPSGQIDRIVRGPDRLS